MRYALIRGGQYDLKRFTIASPKDADMMDVVAFDPVTLPSINEYANFT